MVHEQGISAIVLTVVGIGTLITGAYYAQNIRVTLKTGSVKRAWDKLLAMIVVFTLGYGIYLSSLLKDLEFIDVNLLVALIFFGLSVFVATVSYLNYEALT